jgi:ubiquilin
LEKTNIIESLRQILQMGSAMQGQGGGFPAGMPGVAGGMPGLAGGLPNIPAGAANPALQAMLSGMAGMSAPQDSRPPEERFQDQLRQLNDMGFYDATKNLRALTMSGGNVEGAVEFLLTQP